MSTIAIEGLVKRIARIQTARVRPLAPLSLEFATIESRNEAMDAIGEIADHVRVHAHETGQREYRALADFLDAIECGVKQIAP